MPVPKGMNPKAFYAKEEKHGKGYKKHPEGGKVEKAEHSPRNKALKKKLQSMKDGM
jgi:hypothetical protein